MIWFHILWLTTSKCLTNAFLDMLQLPAQNLTLAQLCSSTVRLNLSAKDAL